MKTATLCCLVLSACFVLRQATAQPAVTNAVSAPTNNPYVMVLVTNWYDPQPGLRTVNGLIYDPTRAQMWQSVIIPEGAAALGARYYGSIQPIDLTFTWGSLERRDQQTVVVDNYPYDPRDFKHARNGQGELPGEVVTAHALFLRLFPMDVQTNWTPLGKMWIGQRTYDYGLPYTNKVPVATWQRVLASQLPKPPERVIPTPQPMGALSQRNYVSGSLSDRFAAIQSIAAAPKRDDFLLRLSIDAAHQSDVPMTKESVSNINNVTLRDQAAQMAAVTLAQNGKRDDAYTIADMITNPERHKMLMEQLQMLGQ
jgi:hypothetical protein